MITCKQCGHGFLSIWREHYPGGAETGVTILLWGVGQLLVALFLCALGFFLSLRGLYLFAALLLLMGLFKIGSISENRRMIIAHGGHKCPHCGAANEIHWYD